MTYTPTMSTGVSALTLRPRRAAPAPARTRRCESSSSAAAWLARSLRCGFSVSRSSRIRCSASAACSVAMLPDGSAVISSVVRSGVTHSAELGAPSKATMRASSVTSERSSLVPGRSRWKRKRTTSSVVRFVTAFVRMTPARRAGLRWPSVLASASSAVSSTYRAIEVTCGSVRARRAS